MESIPARFVGINVAAIRGDVSWALDFRCPVPRPVEFSFQLHVLDSRWFLPPSTLCGKERSMSSNIDHRQDLEPCGGSWLFPHRDGYLHELNRLGYAARTIVKHRNAIDLFIAQAGLRGVDATGMDEAVLAELRDAVREMPRHHPERGVVLALFTAPRDHPRVVLQQGGRTRRRSQICDRHVPAVRRAFAEPRRRVSPTGSSRPEPARPDTGSIGPPTEPRAGRESAVFDRRWKEAGKARRRSGRAQRTPGGIIQAFHFCGTFCGTTSLNCCFY